MTSPFLRFLAVTLLRLVCLLAVVTLALAVGFVAGWGAHITLATSNHHRWMAPPVPGDLALYEPLQSSVTASTAAPVLNRAPDAAGSTPVRPAAGQALRGIRMTWYCLPGISRCTAGYPADCRCVAVSPDLAELRGQHVSICRGPTCVEVLVVDCTCQAVRSVDAYASVFRLLAPLSRGVIEVRMEGVEL